MQQTALALLAKGYVPLRADPNSKAVIHNGWQIEIPTEETLKRAFARPSNLGVRCGDIQKDGTCLIGIDIDIEEAELIRCVERAIGVKVPVKRGRKGYTYFIRLDREQKSTKFTWERDGKKTAAIDILAKNAQTIVPPSIHPDTGVPYQWVGKRNLLETDYRSLPVFGPSVLDEIRGFCKKPNDAIYKLNDMTWAGVGGGGDTHDTCLVAVSSMVARKWTDEDIQARIQRAKQEACERAGMPYDWPQAQKVIQEWIDSSRDKKYDTTSKHGKGKPRVDDIPLEMLNRYCYVISTDRMYDLKKGVMLNITQFSNIHARDLPKPWQTMLMHPDLRIVDKITYAPGQPRFCSEKSFDNEAMLDCLNVYSPPDIEPCDGDVSPFIELVKEFCDQNEEAYTHVLSFFAYAIQNPGARINHALVFQGEQGIGKDTIVQTMERVIGVSNSSFVTLAHIESQFNDWLFGKQMIVFEEILAAGRRNIYNKLKPYITNPHHTINTKHIALQRLHNRAFYIFMTNYKHSLSIDPGDRRVWVWYSQMQPKSKTYYEDYYNWLGHPSTPGAIMKWLLEYDTSAFSATAAPPMTGAKRHLIEASSSELEQYLRQAVDSRTWPMSCDLINVPHLIGAMRPFMRASASMVNEALDNICGTNGGHLEQRPRFDSARLRLRAVRNWSKWKDAKPEALVEAYMQPLPPQSGETEGSYQAYVPQDVGGSDEDTGGQRRAGPAF